MNEKKSDTIDLLAITRIFLKGKFVIAGMSLLGFCIAVIFAMVSQPLYTSTSKWLPSQSGGELSGLAALAGLGGFNNQNTTNEAFYSEIILSPIVINAIIEKKWISMNGDSISLQQLFEIPEEALVPNLPYQTNKDILNYKLSVILREKCILFTPTESAFSLSVITPDPLVSKGINEYILSELKNYDEGEKQSKSSKEKEFLEDRLQLFENSLKDSETKLLRFQQANRNMQSPRTMLENKRLLREVTINSNLVVEFRKQLEIAKANQARKIQDFRIIHTPNLPIKKSHPRRLLMALAGGFLGFSLGFVLVLLHSWWNINREEISSALR